MIFDYIAIGSGVAGLSSIENLLISLKKNTKKILNKNISLALIDREPKNIPGGVGYSFNTAKYGYFNNPLRLSPKDFIYTVKNDFTFKNEIINYLKQSLG